MKWNELNWKTCESTNGFEWFYAIKFLWYSRQCNFRIELKFQVQFRLVKTICYEKKKLTHRPLIRWRLLQCSPLANSFWFTWPIANKFVIISEKKRNQTILTKFPISAQYYYSFLFFLSEHLRRRFGLLLFLFFK